MAYSVFVSYTEQDKKYKTELNKHLSLLKNEGLISNFHEEEVAPGTIWENELHNRLQSANIILLLISADFMASRFCYGVEMKAAIERHQRGEARVIPILLRPTDYESAPFAGLAMLPEQGKCILGYKKDLAYVKISQGIRAAIKDLENKKSQLPSKEPSKVGNNTLHVAREEPATVFFVPFDRNELFTGRKDILSKLRTNLCANRPGTMLRAQVISGLGGIGKTQTALEYAYSYKDEYRYIFWVRAETTELINEDFSGIAERVGLPTKNIQDLSLIAASVKNWLHTHEDWLLILDNADKPEQALGYVGKQLKSGHIVLTSRAPIDARGMHTLDIEKMSDEEGVVFLLRRAGYLDAEQGIEDVPDEQLPKAQEIVKIVDGLPLALVQAGAYIASMRFGLTAYIDRYKSRRTLFLRDRRGLTEEHPESVATTWLLAFEKVEQDNPAAADLLRLCAFLHADAIPEEMIKAGKKVLSASLQECAEDFVLWDEIVSELRRYSLVRRREGETLTIHRLVQDVLRDGLDVGAQKQWAELVVQVVNEAFEDEGLFEVWSKCKLYVLHVQVCAQWIAEWHIESSEALELLTKAGRYLCKAGQYVESEPLLIQARALAEQKWGGETLEVAYVLKELAELRRLQGKFREALPIAQKAVDIYEHDGQRNEVEMATGLNTLGRAYHELGKYPEASELYERALEMRKRVLGEWHPDVAHSLNDLGAIYDLQGKYSLVQSLHEQALEIRKRAYGIEHPDTALSLGHLAGFHQDHGRYSLAEPLRIQVRDLYTYLLGPEHPSTLSSLNSLADLYQDQGRYSLTEPLYIQVRDLRSHLLGPEHPDTLTSLARLASLYQDQGRYSLAEPLLLRARDLSSRVLGPDHPNTLPSLNNLASLYQAQGHYSLAEPLFLQVRDLSSRVLGPDHPNTLSSLNNLASLYQRQSRYSLAEPLFLQVRDLRSHLLGPEHPDTLASLNNLASLYQHQGRYIYAERDFKRVIALFERVLGFKHLNTAKSRHNLAMLYAKTRNFTKAEPLFQQALKVYEETLGLDHPTTISLLGQYASFLWVVSKKRAEKMQKELEERQKRVKEEPEVEKEQEVREENEEGEEEV